MIKKYLLTLLLILSSISAADFSFLHIPIQEEGRIKPIDSFARNQLLKIYGKSKLTIYDKDNTKYNISAIDWLFSIIKQEPSSLDQIIFKVENPDVVKSLNLDVTKKLTYSFNQINNGLNLDNNKELLQNIKQTDKKYLSLVEKQILDLDIKRNLFIKLFNSASCIIPMTIISNPLLKNAFEISDSKSISYFYYLKNQIKIHHNLQKLINTIDESDTSNEILIELKMIMDIISVYENEIFMRNHSSKLRSSDILKLIPSNEVWQSPWNLIDEMKIGNIISDENMLIISMLENLFNDSKINNNINDKELYDYRIIINNTTDVKPKILIREVNYNQSNLFLWSLIFYILTLLSLFIISFFRFSSTNLKLIPVILIFVGFLYHLAGIIIRMTIMERPPVSTLYESIIFVGLITVLFSIILELFKKDYLSLFVGSIGGIILHYISFGYAADGDTLGVLVAVLNSNFWLATHVTTITSGYGATVICSLIGHLYLILAVFNPDNKLQLKTIYKNMLAMTFIALFFTMFGTILGGIWGDQSWGRFWGWDPKENGALLIVMWLLMMIHLKISGMVKGEGYALGLVLANITVALAWFGVNLLSVGLHSYGFTEGAAFNLFMFIIFEILFGFTLYGMIKYKYYYLK
tara:strand:+ start:1235 stop:3142 length:1908 start_codon:yes stop_codon:yes gene_type:complete